MSAVTDVTDYVTLVIGSFGDKRNAAVFRSRMPKGFPSNIAIVARRKLRMLDAAVSLNDLRVPPANRLEALSGRRDGQHSIRINDQWRVCFVWHGGAARHAEIVDHHQRGMIMAIGRQDMAAVLDTVEPDASLSNVHPDEVLGEEFMKPLGLSARALAREINVPPNRITGILNGDRNVSAETAILLGERLGTSAEFWMNLQVAYDLEEARTIMRWVT